ncbi:DUF1861 family protein [Lapidilactobacillus achengensis]|uniref:DUF1861 family protein n=1 Tax=Lapidilactobacillus achengensis TaxID=2486000 RepID=A0ABW1UMX7_9LACO|nr:DUF1861 family protein [Lapidilactobacillus achengensis]
MKTIDTLLESYRRQRKTCQIEKMVFTGVGDRDVYNTSTPFELNHQILIAGRVEPRDSEQSQTVLFRQVSQNRFAKIPDFSLALQDPFITQIDGEILLGGVQVDWSHDSGPVWRTEFYRLNSDLSTDFLFAGPSKMKDIRLCQLRSGQILVLTRPQGGQAGAGKIGLVIAQGMEELCTLDLNTAPLLENNFSEGTWGGANQIEQISKNVVYVLGHIARMVGDSNRNYYALSFYIDLEANTIFGERIIAERKDYLAGPCKRDDLADVVFTSGQIVERDSGKRWLMCGTSDCEEQIIEFYN